MRIRMKRKILSVGVCMLLGLIAALPISATNTTINSPLNGTITKWVQPPDITENGTDVAVTFDAAVQRELADDFQCTTPGPITNVILWGSWMNDQVVAITNIHLSIHADIPAAQSPTGYSIPGAVLWQMNFTQDLFIQKLYHEGTAEWWYDPYTDMLLPQADHEIWECNITINPAAAFNQQGTAATPIVYWLDVSVIAPGGTFGWKTTPTHWNDDAVYLVPGANPWMELTYPPGHPHLNQSIDLAFQINTAPPTITVVLPKLSFGQIPIKVTAAKNLTQVVWVIGTEGKFWNKPPNPNFMGVIDQLTANKSTTIHAGPLFGFGKFNLTVQVDGMSPIKTTGFIFVFIILVHPPSPNE